MGFLNRQRYDFLWKAGVRIYKQEKSNYYHIDVLPDQFSS